KILFDQGAWAELAAFPVPGQNIPDGVSSGLKALYHRLAGQAAETDKAIEELKKAAETQINVYQSMWVYGRALLFNERPEDTVTLLGKHRSILALQPRAEILCQQGKYADALPLMERKTSTFYAIPLATARARTLNLLGETETLSQLLQSLRRPQIPSGET